MPKVSSRVAAYAAIDSERDYQDSLGPDRTETQEPRTVGEELTLLDTYLRKAQDAWSNNPGDVAALDQIRKVAAIAVRAMENHGSPFRIRMRL